MAEIPGRVNLRWTIRPIPLNHRARDLGIAGMRHVIGWAIGCLLAAVALPPIQMAVGAGYAAVPLRLAGGVLEGMHTATSPAEVAFCGVRFSSPLY